MDQGTDVYILVMFPIPDGLCALRVFFEFYNKFQKLMKMLK